uniref:Uncharacterized protein n=1 Tax=Oryza punctata TaxID=4537 RepID=A0A0E0ME80_ORYPU
MTKRKTVRRKENKGRGGGRCSPCGSRAAARRGWPMASTIGLWIVLAHHMFDHRQQTNTLGSIDGVAAYPSLCPTEAQHKPAATEQMERWQPVRGKEKRQW